jgi:hypothetical protein
VAAGAGAENGAAYVAGGGLKPAAYVRSQRNSTVTLMILPVNLLLPAL